MSDEYEQEITCEGCGSLWRLYLRKSARIIADLIECPLCGPKEEGEEQEVAVPNV